MKPGALINKTRGSVVANKVRLCRGFFDRLIGLLGTRTIAEDEACWLIPCNSIHTVGMQYAIDAYFLDRDNRIISAVENLAPNRIAPVIWKAHSVVEFKSGARREIRPGDEFRWEAES